ncbi:MAG TPA: histidinol dehydrogenase [Solirubrobacterales bacterium]|nr:histidinol dehydrogenase [Solirubrobacterales bacterium]
MRTRRFEWEGAGPTAAAMRSWAAAQQPAVDLGEIAGLVLGPGGPEYEAGHRAEEAAVLELTNRFDATARARAALAVEPAEAAAALAALDPALREALELAAANIRTVAEAQLGEPRAVELPQGQTVGLREVPVGAAGIYAPGGRAAYPSSVLMCAIPAQVAGVERIALASPPGPDGSLHPLVLAAAAFCGVEEIYAMGGAQAIFALAYGTESIEPVDVVAGPGNAWVREAKRAVYGRVGIDSLAGPSELMLVAGHDVDPQWAALDLCAQAEHGAESPVVAVAVEEHVLEAIEEATQAAAAARESVADAPLALVQVPDLSDAIDLANAYAPEHLELLEEDAALLADRVRTAGCVFAGRYGATAFGDYVAGSNHVLPTGGAGRFTGPLGPGAFRRRVSTVQLTAASAAALAPQLDALARAEGLPVHGESGMIRR